MDTQTTLRRPSDTLARLLDEELAFSPIFQRVYSTHLAMALVALDQMGAGPEVLQATFDAHAHGEAEPRRDGDVLAERRRQIDRDGIAATVAARVPALAVGPGSQLFHPMIRLAYALEAQHPGQVAAALLDWETRLQVLPQRPQADGSLDDISTFALAAHATADDFVTLHLVTGARALRVVTDWVDAATARVLAEHALVAMAAGYATVGAPPLLAPEDLDDLRRSDLPGRDAIAERAVASLDPHVVKLANVALREEERTADPLYRLLAARVVGLTA